MASKAISCSLSPISNLFLRAGIGGKTAGFISHRMSHSSDHSNDDKNTNSSLSSAWKFKRDPLPPQPTSSLPPRQPPPLPPRRASPPSPLPGLFHALRTTSDEDFRVPLSQSVSGGVFLGNSRAITRYGLPGFLHTLKWLPCNESYGVSFETNTSVGEVQAVVQEKKPASTRSKLFPYDGGTGGGKSARKDERSRNLAWIRQWLKVASHDGKDMFAAATVSVMFRSFIAEPRFIPSASMFPTLQVGDCIVAEKLTYFFKKPNVNDIVIFKPSGIMRARGYDAAQVFIKRVVALEGDVVEAHDGKLMVNGGTVDEDYIAEPLDYELDATAVPQGSVFVLGDNRNKSDDSHVWGPLPINHIVGRLVLRYWPPKRNGASNSFSSEMPESLRTLIEKGSQLLTFGVPPQRQKFLTT